MSFIYLLHFEQPISPNYTTQHYLGFAEHCLPARIQAHELGRGARLPQVAYQRGICFQVARVWIGDRSLKRRIKNRKASPRLCPCCSASPQPVAYAQDLTPEQIADELIPF